MHIDGSFVLSTFDRTRRLDYGVTELPVHNGIKANFSSYWVNGITTKVNKKKQVAAEKFLKFITSEPAQQLWLDEVGELPSRRAVALREKNLKHPKYGPFIRGLEYAVTTDFKSEIAQRKTFVDMFDRVVLTNMGVIESLRIGAMEDQNIINEGLKR